MNENSVRKEIVEYFNKYCSKCKGICCSKEINAFISEISEWPQKRLFIKKNYLKRKFSKNYPIIRFSIGSECPYIDKNRCIMKPEVRPIDCLSYPIYPIIKITKSKTDFVGLMIHKSCPFAKKIADDKKLINLLKTFWELLLKRIKSEEVKMWIGNKRNYWLDKNIIKVDNDKI